MERIKKQTLKILSNKPLVAAGLILIGLIVFSVGVVIVFPWQRTTSTVVAEQQKL